MHTPALQTTQGDDQDMEGKNTEGKRTHTHTHTRTPTHPHTVSCWLQCGILKDSH